MSSCRICKSNSLLSILNLGDQYLSEFREDESKPAKFPLELVICGDCNQVQLRDTVTQNLLYTNNYGYRSGINDTMRKHLQVIVKEALHKVGYKSGDVFAVADFGANDGTLLKNYPQSLVRCGFDLVPKFAEYYKNTGIHFTTCPLNENHPKFKIITAISMFYDLDNPVKFLSELSRNLDKKGILVIQQNYLLNMLQINGFDNIGFEHIMYYGLEGMEKLVDKVGLEIFDVSVNDLNGGSFRTYICHKGDYNVNKRVPMQLAIEREYGLDSLGCFKDFERRVNERIGEIREFLHNKNVLGKKVFLLAASTRGNTLLQSCGINSDWCGKAVERNPEKYGKYISSVGIPIVSEEEGLKENPDYLFVLPFFFRQELSFRFMPYMKKGGKLVFPLPKLEVVGYKDGGVCLVE